MNFTRYASIENSYRTKFLNKIIEEGHGGEEFCVQEKVHGANFSFIINDSGVRMGKRSGLIKDDESFYNANFVFDKYEVKMKALWEVIRKTALVMGTKIEYIQVFGELHGGRYDHPDVAKSGHGSVQKEVQYCPEQDFIAFDIHTDGRFLGVDAAELYFSRLLIPYCEILFRGSLEDCLAYENTYITTIPTKHGLPEIKDNICEGNVIRPISNNLYLWDSTRLIVKNKNERYAEKTKTKKPKETKMPQRFPEHLQPLLDSANEYINENRLKNVLSKVGDVTQKDFGKLVGLFSKDIIEDFMKDNDKFSELGKTERSQITRSISKAASLTIRNNFVNILDGEF